MRKRKLSKFLIIIVVSLLVLITFLYLDPIKTASLISHSKPSQSFQESLQRIDDLKKEDAKDIDPAAQTILMQHGSKTRNVIVFFHGFTRSPLQFKALAEEFYKLGYNVYIPRMPHHGFKEVKSANLEKLTAEDLVSTIDESIDIAQGLGSHVIVAGISMGGVMAGWAAHERKDIDKAVVIAPFFGINGLPDSFFKPFVNFLIMKPDSFIWWDSKKRENLKVIETSYKGFSSRALGEVCRLGWYVKMLGEQSRPKTQSILVVTNANDHRVSKEATDIVIRNWQKQGMSQFQHYEFPKSLNAGHDLIDPKQPDQKILTVYPILLSLIIEKHLR